MNNYFMHGGHFNFDENTETIDSYVILNKTGSNTLRLRRTTSARSIQEHTSNKILLDIVSNRRP